MSVKTLRMSRDSVLAALERRESIDLVNADIGGVVFRAHIADTDVSWSNITGAVKASASGADAAAEDESLPAFDMTLYTGAPIRQWWSRIPVVVDLAGMKISAKARPVVADHWTSHHMVVGHTTEARVVANTLRVKGVVSGIDEAAQRVVKLAKRGFPWQGSLGASFDRVERVEAGAKVTVNGRSIDGPVDVIRQSHFDEASFVVLGADDDTEASVAAGRSRNTNQETGMDPETTNGAVTAAAPKPTTAAEPDLASVRMKIADEYARIAAIEDRAKGHPGIVAKAVAENWSPDKVEAEVLKVQLEKVRAERAPNGAPNIIASDRTMSFSVLGAAIAMGGKLQHLDKHFKEPEIEAASRQFRHGIGLEEVFVTAAQMNGMSVRNFKSDPKGVLRAAFSTVELSGILSNTANKFLLEGWNMVDQAWREIAAIGRVSDFKTRNSYRLRTGGGYQMVPPTGEIAHGQLAQTAYTNKADTYGEIFVITREDIINDDLGALTTVPQNLGQDAQHKLNDVFWAEFMVNSSFFTSGNGSYFEGAATNLQISSLTTAEQMFYSQTNPSGKPLGIMPKILLVPPALAAIARQMYVATEVRPIATSKEPVANPFAGMFKPVTCPYLSNSTFTGYSSTAWFLLADPRQLATIEVVFLDGKETPTIESAEADFNTLGVQMRGIHDFGVNQQEYRGGVKSKGAA